MIDQSIATPVTIPIQIGYLAFYTGDICPQGFFGTPTALLLLGDGREESGRRAGGKERGRTCSCRLVQLTVVGGLIARYATVPF